MALVTYQRMQGNSNDATGNGHNGTDTSIAYTNEGPTGNTANFDAAGDQISIASDSAFDLDVLTLGCWARLDNVGNYSIIDRLTTSNNGYRLNARADGSIWISYGWNASAEFAVLPSSSYSAGDLVYIVGTMDGSNLKIYLNGVLGGTTASTRTYSAGALDILIGEDRIGDTTEIDGTITEAFIDNRVWTGAEIKNKFAYWTGHF